MQVGGHDVVDPERPLGRGGFGVVLEARHAATGRPCALKVATHRSWRTPAGARAFRREVTALARLDHPAVPRVLDLGSLEAPLGCAEAGAPWLLLELARGEPLSRRVPGPAELRAGLVEILGALAHAHARGLVHGDLSPSNVLLGPAGARLVDFGLARAAGDDGEGEPVVGTLPFMAPEQRAGRWRDLGPWTDVFGVGAVAWWCLVGAPPASLPVEPPPGLPPAVARWLARALDPALHRRFATAAECARELPPFEGSVEAATAPAAVTVTLTTEVAGGPAAPGVLGASAVDWVPSWRGAERPRRGGIGAARALWGLAEPPLVGREELQDRLWATLAEPGRGALLVGPAGVGKSRLARWVVERGAELGVAQGWRAGAEGGVAGLAAAVLGVSGLTGAARAARIEAWKAARGATWAVGEVEGLLDGGRAPSLLADLLVRAAAGRRAVVWIDDAPLALELLEVAPTLLAAGVCLVATARSEHRALAGSLLDGFEVCAVGPLGRDDHLALVRDLVALEPAVAARVAQTTAGNPLFAVQLVQSWLDRGLLAAGPAGLALRAEPELPEDLAATWRERLAAVGEGDLALDVAAALGEEVDREEWRAATVAAGGVADEELWARLAEHHLAEDEGTRARFVHGLARAAVAERSRAEGRWARANEAVAALLAPRKLAVDRVRRGLALREAGRTDEAREALLRAAGRFARDGRFVEAERWLADCRALSAGRPPDDPVLEEATAIEVEVLALTSRHGQAVATAERALRQLRGPAFRVNVLRMSAYSLNVLGRADEARRTIDQAAEEGRRAGVDRRSTAHVIFQQANGDLDDGRMELARGRFLELADVFATDADELVAPACCMASVAALFLGRVAEALDLARRGLHEAQRRSLLHPEAYARCGIAYALHAAGDQDGAEAELALAADRFERTQNPGGVGIARRLGAEVARERGRVDEARGALLDLLPVLDRLDPTEAIQARLELAYLEARAGGVAAAEGILAEVRPTAVYDRLGLLYARWATAAPEAWWPRLEEARALRSATGLRAVRNARFAELAATRAPDEGARAAARAEVAAADVARSAAPEPCTVGSAEV